jgi:hypothetical protein
LIFNESKVAVLAAGIYTNSTRTVLYIILGEQQASTKNLLEALNSYNRNENLLFTLIVDQGI